jgi:hypothetical protein
MEKGLNWEKVGKVREEVGGNGVKIQVQSKQEDVIYLRLL